MHKPWPNKSLQPTAAALGISMAIGNSTPSGFGHASFRRLWLSLIVRPLRMTARQIFSVLALVPLMFLMSSCESPKSKSQDVVARLCQHIVQKRQKMIVDTNQAEIVWSDGAILEVGTNFPSKLENLIARPTHYHDIRSLVKQLDAVSTSWTEAFVTRSARGDSFATIRSSDGTISVSVESVYAEYLGQRYPTAVIRIRGESGPIIFVVDGQIRASVMPVKF